MDVLTEQTLELVRSTFNAYMSLSNYNKQYRDEIITEFERYIKWIKMVEMPPGGGVVVPFSRDQKG